MTPRERFLAVSSFEEPDYVPILSCNAINGPNMYTVSTWQRDQGFPSWVDSPEAWDRMWGMNRIRIWYPGGPGEAMPPPEVVSRDGVYETLRYADGRVVRQRIGQTATNYYGMPQFIRFPCETRDDWEEYRDRWVPMGDGIYPTDWDQLVESWAGRDYPLGTRFVGGFAPLRSLFGTNLACKLFYRDPDLIMEILSHLRERHLRIVGKLLRDVDLDFAAAGEDFCYRSGCLVSPAIFREFIIPHYRDQVRRAREAGIGLVYVDSDGFVEDTIGLLEEAGVNGLQAFEVRAGNDVRRVRQDHPDFVIWGGLDKFVMDLEDPAAALGEIDSKVPGLLAAGGYFPGIDHGLPPTSRWRTYLAFIGRLHELCHNPEGMFREHLS